MIAIVSERKPRNENEHVINHEFLKVWNYSINPKSCLKRVFVQPPIILRTRFKKVKKTAKYKKYIKGTDLQ